MGGGERTIFNFQFSIFNSKKRSKKPGFTLVEILVDIAIIALVATAVVSAFMAGYKIIALSKAKVAAIALANEKMEDIRNMPYDDLATQFGPIYPAGEILDSENFERKSMEFRVVTDIRFVDDPFDGNAAGTITGKPKDIYPYDYKKVTITVYKTDREKPLAIVSTNVSSKAAETPTNTGILYLCIIDASGAPVSFAEVVVTNDDVDPPVDISTTTDETGCIMIPGLPPDSHNNYHLEVTKDGYSTTMTYPRTAQNPNALNPDIDILAQQVTNVTLTIDKVSTLRIRTNDLSGAALPNITLHIEGSKEKYFNPSTFIYSEDHVTDGSGFLELTEMEFDDYKISVVSPGFYLSSASPVLPVKLNPDSVVEVTIKVTNSATAPRITSVIPSRGVLPDLTSITVTGENFDNSAIIKLINPNTGVEIVGTDVAVHAHQSIIADFNLALATIGFWDIQITNPGGELSQQSNGFEVVSE